MGDLLDEILAEMAQENKRNPDTIARWKRNNAARWNRIVAARIKLTDLLDEFLRVPPRKDNGCCLYCGENVTHKDDCIWFRLRVEYTTYVNRHLKNKRTKK